MAFGHSILAKKKLFKPLFRTKDKEDIFPNKIAIMQQINEIRNLPTKLD